eukprot:CAMPEP_0201477920 /NCGR_PEP_ID=MMETSP0151_2-20130828/2860_1 /ASSEMBLY_ACC=CAM_ASM_000257 /TAXON_ID=200890 /ORGANISM="Paramoeba atlantica, Strain 621/1 / CCAP 1560/9" /LENGTH=117 /DNA_ID=CAMNT_0047858803 /DNA_START=66 /DNA_END=419 /DNA_ORIENTATION=-
MSKEQVFAQLQSLSDTYNVSSSVRKRKEVEVSRVSSSKEFMKKKRKRKRMKIEKKDLTNSSEGTLKVAQKKIERNIEEEEEPENPILAEIKAKEAAKDWTNLNLKIYGEKEKKRRKK